MNNILENLEGKKMIYYIIIFSVLYYTLTEIDINLKTIVSLLASGVIVYYLISQEKSNKIKKSKVLDKSFKNINNHSSLKKRINDIKYLRKYNKRTFDLGVKHLDNFLYYINVINHSPYAVKQVYDIAKDSRKNALNEFGYIFVSLPGMPANKKNDLLVSSGNEEELTKFIEDIRILTYEKLQEIGSIVNEQWKNSTNMYSAEVDIDKDNTTFSPSGVDSHIDKYSIN
jgi:hypothetical protein